MLGKEGDRPGRSKAKKGKKKKDEPSVDSPRPLGMPPDYPSTEVSCFCLVNTSGKQSFRRLVCIKGSPYSTLKREIPV